MGFLDRFRAPVPDVEAGAETRERVEQRMSSLVSPASDEQLAEAVRLVVREDLWPCSEAWRQALGGLEKEVESELFLCVWAGCAGAIAARSDWEVALARLSVPMGLLREYVPFSCRDHYDDGPQGLIYYSRTLFPKEPDVVKATLVVMAKWMCLPERKGVLEGWHRLGLLAWLAGEIMAESVTWSEEE